MTFAFGFLLGIICGILFTLGGIVCLAGAMDFDHRR